MLPRLVLRFARSREANVAVIFALAMVPTIFLLGMALDYTHAQRMKVELDAATDAAGVAAVTSAMMQQSPQVAQATAQNIFNITANTLVTNKNLAGKPTFTVALNCSNPNATTGYCTYPACPGTDAVYSDPVNSNNQVVRNVQVCYDAASNNSFPGVLHQESWPVAGQSATRNQSAPNINFYLLLDDSPSMAIGATSNDINALIARTQKQVDTTGFKGCGFACHQTNPAADNLGNPGGVDNYQLARNLGLTLRIDRVTTAVQSLMDTAQSVSNTNRNTYGIAIYTYDYQLNSSSPIFAPSGKPGVIRTPVTPATTTSYTVQSIQNAASSIEVLSVYKNNWLTSSNNNSDADTSIAGALNSLNNIMPNPGNGTNVAGDTPQEVIFLVTDGVEDVNISTDSYTNACNKTLSVSGSVKRCQQPLDPAICTTIKNKKIRIAVLYTEYDDAALNGTDAWYDTWVHPYNGTSSQIETNLQSCASPGLYQKVATNDDIASALQQLFLKVASNPRLTQ